MKKAQTICFLLVFIFTTQTAVFSQTPSPSIYRAVLISKKGTNAERKDVLISQENETLKIDGAKDRKISKSFSTASIKNVSYSYSQHPQIKEAVGIALVTGGAWIAVPFFFNKDKRHWLVITTETENVFLELQKNNYRQLLFEMNASGIKVEDLGDRDSMEMPARPKPASDPVKSKSSNDVPSLQISDGHSKFLS